MRINRVYIDLPDLGKQTQLMLEKEQAHRLQRVLRLKEKSYLQLFNGLGTEYAAYIIEFSKNSARLRLSHLIENNTESPLHTILWLGISRRERMDYALQKSVELGVNCIQPLFTRYCEVKLSEARIEKRLQHWKGIIISACEQSGRSSLPILNSPLSLDQVLKQPPETACFLLFHPESSLSLRKINLSSSNRVVLLIGPEGGLSDDEVALAKQHRFTAVQLGKRVLRTETAPVAALSALQTLFGDF